jgi:nitrite reductase/ring-hydroxylating ferredoxin subunit
MAQVQGQSETSTTSAASLQGTGGEGTAEPSFYQNSTATKIVDRLEKLPLIDPVDRLLTQIADAIFAGGWASGLADFLHGRWLGHALHPALSDLPVGLWTSSTLADLAGMDGGAALLSGAGSAAALMTAASGLADWRDTVGRDRRLGALHGLVNVMALSFQIGSLVAHVQRRRTARALRMTGWLISMGSAYLGGELVFGRGWMVDHTAWTSGPSEWTAVLSADQLAEGRCAEGSLNDRKLLLFKKSGRVYALENACAHAGGPLSEGSVEGDVVTCPWHGSQFRLTDGALLRGPSTFPQLRLQTRVNNGNVEVRGRNV